ncbi:MAG: transcriptional regulator [Candidatus Thorarchaeota archaeon]|nr:transcriptional regulator [Candidatus Thorarchaeota archaeon]
MATRREQILEMLERTSVPLTVQDICNALDLDDPRVVSEDLGHIAKSIRSQGRELVARPAQCNKCGFVFSDRATVKKPSRCPKCKSEWIQPPGYLIRVRR